MNAAQALRADLAIVADLIKPGARVLDLGCGRGHLLAWLQQHKQVIGYGLDIEADNITACLAAGVNVVEYNLDDGLEHFSNDSFDMVVMTETLQAVRQPRKLLTEMLRVADECIVTFPNIGHWSCRMSLAMQGRMPVSNALPYQWFDTPNIHICTFKDFEALCREEQLAIIERFVVDQGYSNSLLMNLLPNLFGRTAFYRLGR